MPCSRVHRTLSWCYHKNGSNNVGFTKTIIKIILALPRPNIFIKSYKSMCLYLKTNMNVIYTFTNFYVYSNVHTHEL
jgi:hypothetical protein